MMNQSDMDRKDWLLERIVEANHEKKATEYDEQITHAEVVNK